MGLVSYPEAKLANLIIKRNGLKPGFDIKEFLATQADLRFGKIPGDVDGISINLKNKRPVVIISTDLPPTRQKFTMAHELGHIVIPWHIGTIFSHTNENHAYATRLYHDSEVEANKFAAELLMPSEWVKSILSTEHPKSALETIRKISGTSIIATFYKVGSLISDEYIGVLTDLRGRIINFVSNNPRLITPENGELIKDQAVYKSASEVKLSIYPQNIIYWLKYSDVVAPKDNDLRSWREILNPIIEELKLDKHLVQSLSGCISCINRPGVMHEEFFRKARQRIASDNDFLEVSKHLDFELFLVKRIDEMIRNRK